MLKRSCGAPVSDCFALEACQPVDMLCYNSPTVRTVFWLRSTFRASVLVLPVIWPIINHIVDVCSCSIIAQEGRLLRRCAECLLCDVAARSVERTRYRTAGLLLCAAAPLHSVRNRIAMGIRSMRFLDEVAFELENIGAEQR